ncbi:isoprenoid biosynthesis protein with amidotransferase-like domain [Yersinia enterocolitica]|uniref:Glyoxalase n=1 Tax=Yersinia enterocolitica serotype O:8 / biotype 1B (strain NCTC 13174 / 8081) TaxID=393305 RepID=A1JR79_YERE8|nr:isoprenoid biosynthesis glyoxalase ElbB [Yersinia enterocolitica]AJI81482.1 enhancing lycopene biosynthesis protein 2 [Yersinia enterocolitica]AJJ22858.1 enhancing lycopene biosynthesis protein 2 [Yersinia enterocolitica]EKA26261.1 isoprenoid biosynthesis protein with amidotransferase-like domain [Yersinia enterocolitica subsp. enterocolitica WA-314]ELI8281691.1 isoprenoid biosynthesis glyoxalase ElbB [Yersinia enterocolitica]KGA68892.1 enhancing lycopene biosynthesis protein 2 [Yersinia en
MKTVGVVLSGCGVLDGTEIHESVLTILALDRAGARIAFFAPDKPQLHVINHLSGEESTEQRNVLVESARIARSLIKPLSVANSEDLDALIVPGGFGAAKNLSDFAIKGSECAIDPDLVKLTQSMHKANKPIGFMCISPVMLPKLLGKPVRLTIGNDPDTIEAVEIMGGEHIICPADDVVVDAENKVVTTPAYMLAASISEAAKGIDKLVAKVLDLTE